MTWQTSILSLVDWGESNKVLSKYDVEEYKCRRDDLLPTKLWHLDGG